MIANSQGLVGWKQNLENSTDVNENRCIQMRDFEAALYLVVWLFRRNISVSHQTFLIVPVGTGVLPLSDNGERTKYVPYGDLLRHPLDADC
jgi:hypothetical protein